MMHSAGDCPTCFDSGALLFVVSTDSGLVLAYCPACGCAWRDPREALEATSFQGLDDFGVSEVRGATRAEIAAAGSGDMIVRDEDDWPLP